jgi:uncharacterized membrane-anchored protein
MGIVLVIALVVQFSYNKYVPWIYWLNVVLISIFGTLLTDNLTDNMGVPLEYSTIFFSVCLILVFIFGISVKKPYQFIQFTQEKEKHFTDWQFFSLLP